MSSFYNRHGVCIILEMTAKSPQKESGDSARGGNPSEERREPDGEKDPSGTR
jgi:hypothetical protein